MRNTTEKRFSVHETQIKNKHLVELNALAFTRHLWKIYT